MSERKLLTTQQANAGGWAESDLGGRFESVINDKSVVLREEGSGKRRGIRVFGHMLSVAFGPRPYWVIYISGLRAGTRPTLQEAIDFAREEAAR